MVARVRVRVRVCVRVCAQSEVTWWSPVRALDDLPLGTDAGCLRFQLTRGTGRAAVYV